VAIETALVTWLPPFATAISRRVPVRKRRMDPRRFSINSGFSKATSLRELDASIVRLQRSPLGSLKFRGLLCA
jgi:hypothetical protein